MSTPDSQDIPIRAQTLPVQRIVNWVVRGLLRAPLTSRLVGKRLLTLYVVGRKSGRRYSVPVAYTQSNGNLLVGSEFDWIRNLRTGEPVHVRLLGEDRRADVQVITDESGVVGLLGTMATDNRPFARFNKIGFDERGNPRQDHLHLAWVAGARVAMFTPR